MPRLGDHREKGAQQTRKKTTLGEQSIRVIVAVMTCTTQAPESFPHIKKNSEVDEADQEQKER
jgi:hypothetical protein